MTDWISEGDWATIVCHVPIVSVDLVVRCAGGVILGKRRNEPAKDEWFVPGGRVHKGERLHEAVDRVAREELDAEVSVLEELGTYEHFWKTSDVPGVDGKHYVTNGYVVQVDDEPETLSPDEQHSELRVFETPPHDLHRYSAEYIQDADTIDF